MKRLAVGVLVSVGVLLVGTALAQNDRRDGRITVEAACLVTGGTEPLEICALLGPTNVSMGHVAKQGTDSPGGGWTIHQTILAWPFKGGQGFDRLYCEFWVGKAGTPKAGLRRLACAYAERVVNRKTTGEWVFFVEPWYPPEDVPQQ